jgi:hypothetical protein
VNANDRDDGREDPTLHIEQVDTPTDGDIAAHPVDSSDTQHIAQPETQQIETTGTAMNQHDPATPGQTPFKVEPATPVADDAVHPDEPSPPPYLQMMPPPPTQPAAAVSQGVPPRSSGLVTVRRGPLPMTIMLGLLSMIVAGFVLVTNLAGADFNLRAVGPMMFGSFGGLLLIVGLIGIIAGGRGRDDR